MVFNAHHAPIGAYATFTLGGAGRTGGMRIGSGHPPRQDVLVGARGPGGGTVAFPWFEPEPGDAAQPIALHEVGREFTATADTFTGAGLSLTVHSPVLPVPEPGVAAAEDLRDGLLPAVLVELAVDAVRSGARRAFFGVRPGVPVHAVAGGVVFEDSAGRRVGIFGDGVAAAGDTLAGVLDGPPGGEGRLGVLRFDVPAGTAARYRLAVAFWHGGTVASGPGIACSYWYTGLFEDLAAVGRHALSRFDALLARWRAGGAAVASGALSADQRFQLVHAVHSYYANTGLLRRADGRPLWAVMEGEFEFVNTLDLAVDLAWFELRQSPWTVRDVLDQFAERGSYRDRFGLGFVHDLGWFPAFAAPGQSAYEQPRRPGRTVLMTSEELTDWALLALLYVAQTGDTSWGAARAGLLRDVLEAIVARDTGDEGRPDGLVSAVTDRTGPYGEEITTFDALDPSVRRARHSSYLAGKQWAACAGLAAFFDAHGDPAAATRAREQAQRAADRIVEGAAEHGHVPGRLAGDGEPADPTADLPVLECLALAVFSGAPVDPDLRATLARHLDAVLRPGRCLFADGGWKLSSAHDNSWLSKVYACQFVARRLLGVPWGDAGRRADATHVAWLTHPDDGAWAFSDQVLAGRIHSSRSYPRGVTAALWLEERRETARLRPEPDG